MKCQRTGYDLSISRFPRKYFSTRYGVFWPVLADTGIARGGAGSYLYAKAHNYDRVNKKRNREVNETRRLSRSPGFVLTGGKRKLSVTTVCYSSIFACFSSTSLQCKPSSTSHATLQNGLESPFRAVCRRNLSQKQEVQHAK